MGIKQHNIVTEDKNYNNLLPSDAPVASIPDISSVEYTEHNPAFSTDDELVIIELPNGNLDNLVVFAGPGGDAVSGPASDMFLYVKSDGTIDGYVLNNATLQGYVDTAKANWTNVKQVIATTSTIFALHNDGTVSYEGSNTTPGGWTNIQKLAVSVGNIVGLKSDGTLAYSGGTSQGEDACLTWTDLIDATPTQYGVIGVKNDNTCLYAGLNSNGQGDAASWTDIVQVSAGLTTAMGLKSDGTVVTCGVGSYSLGWTDIQSIGCGPQGFLGVANSGVLYRGGKLEAEIPAGLTNIAAAAEGYATGAILKTDGTFLLYQDTTGSIDVSAYTDGMSPYASAITQIDADIIANAKRSRTNEKAITTLETAVGDMSAVTTTSKEVAGAIDELKIAVDGKEASLGFTPENSANKGASNGYAGLDSNGKVPNASLQDNVDVAGELSIGNTWKWVVDGNSNLILKKV